MSLLSLEAFPAPGVIIIGENYFAATGLMELLKLLWPALPIFWEPCPQQARRHLGRMPGALVIALLFTRQASLCGYLYTLSDVRHRMPDSSWLLLYEGERVDLPSRLAGMQIRAMSIPLVSLQRTLLLHTGPSDKFPFSRLTPRQQEVLSWIARGQTPHQVSIRLGVAEKTISSHRIAARKRLGLSARHEHLLWSLGAMMDNRHPDITITDGLIDDRIDN